MKRKKIMIQDLMIICKETINMMSEETVREAYASQCYQLDVAQLTYDIDEYDTYKKEILVIASINVYDLIDLLDYSNNLETGMINVLVVPITKKVQSKINTRIGARAWTANRFTALSPYGLAFNNGRFFKGCTITDINLTASSRPTSYGIEVEIIK